MLEAALGCLAHKGRLIDFYHNESRILGADTRKLDLAASAAILDRLAPLFDDGMLEAPLVSRALPLARGIEAYQSVAAGAQGRIVVSHKHSRRRAPCAIGGRDQA
jgi:hypothetical protein